MENPFKVLEVDETEDTSTSNLSRKLNKMKRRYKEKPTKDLKKRIDELEERIAPPPPNPNQQRKKNKKPKIEIDLDEEFRKNRDYWRKENIRAREQEEQKRRQEEMLRKEQERLRKLREEQEQKQREQEQREKQRERQQRQYEKQQKRQYDKLPPDIREFLQLRIQGWCNNIKDLKKIYQKLCLKYHPDKGGEQEHFKIISNHWEELQKAWERQQYFRKQYEQREKDKQRQREKEKEMKQKQDKYSQLPQDIRDFLNIRIFDKDNVPKNVKKIYNKLCLRYHPDKGGNEEYFKIINNHIN